MKMEPKSMLCRVQTFVGMSMDLIRLRLMALLCTLALMGKYIFLFYCYYSICSYGIWHRFSRKVLWLEVASTNNSAAVIAGYYLKAVALYG